MITIKVEDHEKIGNVIKLFHGGVEQEKEESNGNMLTYSISNISTEEIIEVRVFQDYYESNLKSFLYAILYWIAAVAGAVDELGSGLPIKSILKIRVSDDTVIKCLKVGGNEAFYVKGEASVLDNRFYVDDNSYKRWIYSTIIPIEIIVIFLMILMVIILNSLLLSIIVVSIFIAFQVLLYFNFRKVKKYKG